MLLESGHEVEGYDSDLYERCTFQGSIEKVPACKKDIRDVESQDVEGYEAVIHLAALSNDPLGDYRPELTHEINHVASVRLARFAKAAGVRRFLFASSCSTYGASGDEFLDEGAPFNPVTPYGLSKVTVEAELHALADHGFSPTYLRASTAYGLSPRLRFDLVLNNLTAWAFTTGDVRLKSDGSPWRPLVHVEDICRAYLALLEAPVSTVHDRPFNIGSTCENHQIRELADYVRSVVPGSRVTFAPDAAPDTRCYRVDCGRIAREVHTFKPQWTALRGVRELFDAFAQSSLTLEDFEGERFKRITHIKHLIADGILDTDLRHVKRVADGIVREEPA
jgi:nucleoside-diphosphate-sugar epimerase